MRGKWVAGWAVVMAAVMAGCQGGGRCPLAGPRKATVSHVVLCWLKEPGNADQRRTLIETSRSFRDIPGVVSVAVGEALPSTRPVVDSSFDVALVMRFEDEASLRAYDTHPAHQEAVTEVLRPLTAKIVVYDVVDR